MLDLLKPHYRKTAAYGHFGRTDVDLPWERTDKAQILKKKLAYNTKGLGRISTETFYNKRKEKMYARSTSYN